ncbi:hypothetical protein ACIRPK_07205 [Kitasatospora sp. NPDC101801]|uniref:hypothetical protein n=1 Tax=Kitasatospora sp. NPDC101801 TaxID=3364103 RepID=UPI0038095CF4
MFLLGLLLLCAVAAFTGLLIADNVDAGGPDYTVTMFGNDLATMNSLSVFLAGVALTLIFGLGVLLATSGAARARRRAREREALTAAATIGATATDGTPAVVSDRTPGGRRRRHRLHLGH